MPQHQDQLSAYFIPPPFLPRAPNNREPIKPQPGAVHAAPIRCHRSRGGNRQRGGRVGPASHDGASRLDPTCWPSLSTRQAVMGRISSGRRVSGFHVGVWCRVVGWSGHSLVVCFVSFPLRLFPSFPSDQIRHPLNRPPIVRSFGRLLVTHTIPILRTASVSFFFDANRPFQSCSST